MKGKIKFLLTFIIALALLVGCNNSNEATEETSSEEAPVAKEETTEVTEDTEESEEEADDKEDAELPTINYGYMFSNHQAPLIIAAAKGEDFKADGPYLKEVLEKEAYVLMDGDKEISNVNLIVGDNGGELMTLMNQDRLDMAFGSVGLPLTNIDEGSAMKVMSPIHVDGIGLVMLTDKEPSDYDSFVNYVEGSDVPVKVGYHSPQNAPVILFTKALEEAGYKVTEDETDTEADIQLINLKGTANLIPSLQNGEVDAYIGPSPFPELAEVQEIGKIVFDLKDLPPSGKWENFPCCVMIGSDSALESKSEEIKSLFNVISRAADFANTDKDAAAEIVADWMGVDLEAAKRTGTVYTTNPTENWYNNFNVTYENLQEADKFTGEIKDKDLEEVKDKVFDLGIAEEYHN